jgi:EDD domain protein, DegV family
MNKVVVMTDTSSAISQEIAKNHGIAVIPWHVIMDGKDCLDTRVDMARLYAQLKGKGNLPTTSGYTTEECSQHFHRLGKDGNDILYIAMTSAMSTMAYAAAMQAKKIAQENLPQISIEVIDSRTVGPAQLLLVIAAAKAARQGKSLKEITKSVNNLLQGISELEAADTLFYLDKGGRIFKAKSWAEAQTVYNFRTIVEIDAISGGAASPLARAKTKRQIMEKVVDIVKERVGGDKLVAAIVHTNVPDQAKQLREMVLSEFQCDELYICEALAVTAIHNGEGLIELGFYRNEEQSIRWLERNTEADD